MPIKNLFLKTLTERLQQPIELDEALKLLEQAKIWLAHYEKEENRIHTIEIEYNNHLGRLSRQRDDALAVAKAAEPAIRIAQRERDEVLEELRKKNEAMVVLIEETLANLEGRCEMCARKEDAQRDYEKEIETLEKENEKLRVALEKFEQERREKRREI